MKYSEVLITRSNAGFGLYDTRSTDSEYSSVIGYAKMIERAFGYPVYRVGSGIANKMGVKDVTGLVHDEPSVILGSACGNFYGLNLN